MGMTTLVRTLLGSVTATLQDNPQFSRWPERELVVYANYGQTAIAKYLPQAGARSDSIKLRPGTKQDLTKVAAADIKPSDGSGAVDTYGIALLDVVRNMGPNGQVPGRVVRVVDRETRDNNDPDWHSKTGPVVREYVAEKALPKVFYAVPGVPADVPVWVDINWLAEPKRIPAGGASGAEIYLVDGASTELLGINDQFVEDLHNYIVAIALLKGSKNTQNVEKAKLHAAMFTSSINAQASMLTGVNPNLKQLPFAAELGAAA